MPQSQQDQETSPDGHGSGEKSTQVFVLPANTVHSGAHTSVLHGIHPTDSSVEPEGVQ